VPGQSAPKTRLAMAVRAESCFHWSLSYSRNQIGVALGADATRWEQHRTNEHDLAAYRFVASPRVVLPATGELFVSHGMVAAVDNAAMPRHVKPFRRQPTPSSTHACPSMSPVELTSNYEAVSD
jgi:hypothetical protein